MMINLCAPGLRGNQSHSSARDGLNTQKPELVQRAHTRIYTRVREKERDREWCRGGKREGGQHTRGPRRAALDYKEGICLDEGRERGRWDRARPGSVYGSSRVYH